MVSAHSRAGQYYVEYLEPRGAQRGTTVDVIFHGALLADPKEVIFYDKGIEASELQSASVEREERRRRDGSPPAINKDPNNAVKARFKIAPDCPLGQHVLRLRTSAALCEWVTFWVSPFPTVMEEEKKPGENDTPETAQRIPLNVTVHGEILPGETMDRDCYRVEMKKGQRLSVEVEAIRLATLHRGGENDLMLRILDASGKELAKNDDNALFIQDPFASIAVPEDGAYIVEIGQQMFTQPQRAWYHAHIGTFVRPTAIYPMGGPVGEKIEARIIGDPLVVQASSLQNAGGTPTVQDAGRMPAPQTQSVELPKQLGDFPFCVGKEGETPPSPNMLRVSNYPNVLEVEPNDTPETATPVPSLPVALNGIIDKPGDLDCFRFHMEKGKTWRIRVYARALGTPIDPKIWIRPLGQTANEAEKDDSTLAERDHMQGNGRWRTRDQVDPSLIFSPRQTGDYVLGVEDTRGQGGPDYVYRVEIEPLHEKIVSTVSVTNNNLYQYYQRMDFPAGNRFTRNITLAPEQGAGLKGEFELEAVGLPKGVTMIAPHFIGGQATMPVQFVVDADAPLAGALIELRAKQIDAKVPPVDAGSNLGMAFIDKRGGYGWYYVFVDKIGCAVVKPAPYSIELVQPAISLVQSGELSLQVKVHRNEGFKGAIEIQTDWLPNGVTRESAQTIPADKSEGKLTLQAAAKANPGVFKIAMLATTLDGDRESGTGCVRVSSAFVDLRVSAPYLTVQIPRASVERGQKGTIVCDLKQNTPFEGEATCALKRLPHGVNVVEPLPKITAKDAKVTFHIEATDEALVGLYKEIFCEVTVVENGQSIRQQSGSGVLRVDPAKGIIKAAKAD